MIYSDLTLSQKLEGTEALASVDLLETRVRLMPESTSAWIKVGGTYAMFDGVGSPVTQTFGLGIFQDTTDEHLDEIEEFFRERGSDVFHEVSPMTNPALMALLVERGYKPIELTSVMFRELEYGVSELGVAELGVPERGIRPAGDESRPAARCQTLELSTLELPTLALKTRRIEDSETDVWAETVAAGWSSEPESLGEFMLGFARIAAGTRGGNPFLVEMDGRPVAAGSIQIYDDVGLLAGASTIPEARRNGAQNALLKARLRFAADSGCRFAMVCAQPGSQSQKNAQRNGFQMAYTRTKWQLTI